MRRFRNILLGVTLTLLLPFRLVAQPEKDTLVIQFRLDSTSVDLSYADNAANWQQFVDRFNSEFSGRSSETIQFDIYAGASPEGSRNRNMRLGQQRGDAIAALVRKQLGKRAGTIEVHNLGPRWDDLYDRVAASDEPWRDEVLKILRTDYNADPRYIDPREMHLRSLQDGTVWPVLLKEYLAPLRGGSGTVVVSWQPRDTVFIRDTVFAPREKDTIVIIHENYVTAVPVVVKKERVPADQTPAWAVKTNLALWGVVAPNVQVELPLGRSNRWSIEFEYFQPWFIWNRNSQASQCVNLGVEGRYWLGKRQYHRYLDGWHIGLALAGGYYDWEWFPSDGYQGEYINTYFNIGYQLRFGEHWAVDFGIGLGAMGTQYRHYYGGSVYPEGREEEWDQHLIWHDTGYFLWPGPCHANISIVYLFNFKDKQRR